MATNRRVKKKTVWDWFMRVTAITAFILSLFAVYNAHVKAKEERELKVREIYNEAWDVLGEAKGTATIEQGSVGGKPLTRQRAMNLLNQGLAIAPNDPDLLATKGMIFAEEGNIKEAETLYRRALSLGPRDVVAHNGLGVMLQDQGKPAEAIILYQQAINLNPDDLWIVYYNLATAFEEEKRLNEAEVAVRKAIQLRNDFGEAYQKLGDVLAAKNQLAQAKIAREKAKALFASQAALLRQVPSER